MATGISQKKNKDENKIKKGGKRKPCETEKKKINAGEREGGRRRGILDSNRKREKWEKVESLPTWQWKKTLKPQ